MKRDIQITYRKPDGGTVQLTVEGTDQPVMLDPRGLGLSED